MAECKHFIFIYILIIINPVRCDLKHSIHKRVEELANISKQMYGEVTKHNADRNIYTQDRLMYPRGDKRKLAAIAQLWRDYYACSAQSHNNLTTLRQLPSVMIEVYQGSVVKLPCSVCDPPGSMPNFIWMYSQSAVDVNFTLVEDHDRLAIENGNMTIYNTLPEDAGVYWCLIGDSSAGLVVLDVVDTEEPYTVVKPPTSLGPHAIAPEVYKGLIIFSNWSPWSECSVCGKVGRRRRYGICYVKLDDEMLSKKNNTAVEDDDNERKLLDLDFKVMELFLTFPDGVPCRSQYMPAVIRDLDAVQQRSSEIMIAMCKVPCTPEMFSIKYADEQWENETSGVFLYSLEETAQLPKQPPLPTRKTIFADFGQQIAIRCPGTTLRDVPVQWRVGNKQVIARDAYKRSGGRVYLNSRDHLVFTAVFYRDGNLYSCWEWENLAGTVKLIVWQGAHARWDHHITLLAAVIAAAILLRIADRAVRRIQRRQIILFL